MTTAQRYAELASLQKKIAIFKQELMDAGDTQGAEQLAGYLQTESETLFEEIESCEAE